MEEIKNILDYLYKLAIEYGLNLLFALITLFIGLWLIKHLMKHVNKAMEKSDIDLTLRKFLSSLIKIVLKMLLLLSVVSMVGIEMISFVAVFAAATFAIGSALTGTLQNFAGGVMIVLFKPFKVGDFIQAQGFMGTVKEIQIFNTILKTPDNKTIIIPNGGLSNSAMTNFSTEELRRVDFTFGIGYGDDIDKAKKLISGLIEEDERILKDPKPFIAVSELANSSVNFAVRVWANASDYWGIFHDMTENVKKLFDKEGISIPFPQTDVHVYNEK
ncbi:MAG: mechanosensitive ion channel [Bacteroidales bacterium]|nr:mechanosensitive ion channel [Bacteroidales bacterium]